MAIVDGAPLWLRMGAFASLPTAIAFLLVSLFKNSVFPGSLAGVGTGIVVALLLSATIASYSLVQACSVHRITLRLFHDTDREFMSIFQNALDGILILDDDGVCLNANPAAATILRTTFHRLIGERVDSFLSNQGALKKTWKSLVKENGGSARLTAGDGTAVFVEFAVVPGYLPGRHAVIICDVTARARAEICLRQSEDRFQHMADNIQEIFWMMDAATQELSYVNGAYAMITGHPLEALQANPTSYCELIYPEDRARVISRLNETLAFGTFDEEFRFTRADGAIRWVWVKGSSVPSGGQTRWLVGTAQDITSRKQAEIKIVEQIDAMEAARAEADALRKATLALSQNLAMDSVLDTLLNCISDLIPFDRATVLFVEGGQELMVARESPRTAPQRMGFTFKASKNRFFQTILFEKRPLFMTNTFSMEGWCATAPVEDLRSWMGVPLIAAGRVLGILSLGALVPSTFTTEHFRLARSLAIPAAVAIQNARVHECAEIYSIELLARLKQLQSDPLD